MFSSTQSDRAPEGGAPKTEMDETLKPLLKMLTWKRPHMSKLDHILVHNYIARNAADQGHPIEFMGPMNNLIVTVPMLDGSASRTMFSCHTDTVHHKQGIQKVCFDLELQLAYKEDHDPLGADDTAGVWIMMQMLLSNHPGTYIFHRGEECGCIGSHWLADNKKDWLKASFDRAVAFDRRGTTSVITHQRGGQRCCSDEFAQALSAGLGKDWKPDPTGIFTDTGCYMGIIPECTNLSVGYSHEHSKEEMLDCEHLLMLRDTVWTIDWEGLPVKRDPDAKPAYNWQMFNRGGMYEEYDSLDVWPRSYPSTTTNANTEEKKTPSKTAHEKLENLCEKFAESKPSNDKIIVSTGGDTPSGGTNGLAVPSRFPSREELTDDLLENYLRYGRTGIEHFVWSFHEEACDVMCYLLDRYRGSR